MYLIRPVRDSDVDRLLELAELTSFGLTTLPKDRTLLAKRVKQSVRAFHQLDDDHPSGQTYLFVMEETERRLVVGTCGITSKVGGFEPFYAYRIETSVHESKKLGIRREIEVLHLVEEHNGPCEIGSLFLHPEFRHSGNGRLLSLSRFLFMADFPQLFDEEVIAEMRGVIDETGRTPFWDALGRHFFDLEFPKADYLSIVNKEFIGDLMPRYPIYICLLSAEAQAVIGEVHQMTRPARRLLETEGFKFHKLVDIFEAGPVLHCYRDEIRSVRESRTDVVARIADDGLAGPDYLIAAKKNGFACCRGMIGEAEDGLTIGKEVAQALNVTIGDSIRIVLMKAAREEGT